jgi:hypothetical protein
VEFPRARRLAFLLAVALLVAPVSGAPGSAVHIGDDSTVEPLSISEIILAPAGGDTNRERSIQLVQIGNPARRPPLPDLSREGVHDLPGRVSLEVPDPGLRWGDQILPPGIYRLALITDGLALHLRARPLAPGLDVNLPVESGTLTAPGARFRAVLGVRRTDQKRIGYLSLRWGALMLEATLTAPQAISTQVGERELRAGPNLGALSEEVFLGTLEGTGEDSGRREARWIRREGPPRLRLELARQRRMFARRREDLARAGRLASIAKSALDGGDEVEGARIDSLAESYARHAELTERQLAALDGSGQEIVGTPRPATGDSTTVRLEERAGEAILIIDSRAGGAEFALPR